jgi:hypothetical protein
VSAAKEKKRTGGIDIPGRTGKRRCQGGLTMTEMVWELYVLGLLLYGLAFLGIAALSARGGFGPAIPDERDAPIVVTRRSERATTTTVITSTGSSQTTSA